MRRTLLFPLLLCPLLCTASPPPDWRSGWGLVPAPDARPSPVTAGSAASVTLQDNGDRWQARVENHLAGPVQVMLSPGGGTALLPGLPLQTVLQPLATLSTPLQLPPQAQRLQLQLDAIPGDPAARPQDVAYLLPFIFTRFQVTQAPQGRFSHSDVENRDAIDFALPEGTPVLAARAGRVMQLQSGFTGGGIDPSRDRGRVNFIRVLHDDGSMAVYAHLKPSGVLVRRGQQVAAGERIGFSGNTGYSTAPHLHFVVQANVGLQLQSIPVRIVTAQGELHFAREDGGQAPAASP